MLIGKMKALFCLEKYVSDLGLLLVFKVLMHLGNGIQNYVPWFQSITSFL